MCNISIVLKILLKMYLFLKLMLCFYLIGVSYARTEQEIRMWFQTLGIECSKDYPVPPPDLLMLQKHQLPNNDNAKCLLACVHRKAEWMDSKGMFVAENAIAMIEKEHIGEADKIEKGKKLFETCKKVNEASVSDGEKGCERAALLFVCLTENADKLGFNPA